MGRGDKEGGDGRPWDAMCDVIASAPMRGVVGIGEGEKDHIAVDPVDGTTLLANGMPNAIAVLTAADRGSMYNPSAVFT